MELLAFGIMRDIHCHADAEDLESYSMGGSSPEDTARIEEHLLICEDCRNQLQASEAFLTSMQLAGRQWRRNERAAEGSGWKLPVWLPALAAVCGLVLVVVAIRIVRPRGPAVAVSLTALRGSAVGSIAPAGRELTLQPDLTGLAEVLLTAWKSSTRRACRYAWRRSPGRRAASPCEGSVRAFTLCACTFRRATCCASTGWKFASRFTAPLAVK